MATLTDKVQALLTYANGISGKEDTTLGDAVKSLGDGFGGGGDDISAFIEGTLTTITIPNNVTKIGSNAFRGLPNLTTIVMHGGITDIGANAFTGTKLTSINIPGSVKTIVDLFGSLSTLKEVVINEGTKTIQAYAFQGVACPLFDLPSSVSEIYNHAFRNSVASSVTIVCRCPSVVTLSSTKAFTNTNLVSIKVPYSLVDTYKSANVWSNYADIISAIEE